MPSGPPAQPWDAERYARTARFVSELGAPLLDLLAPRPGECVLDLGCGDGELTARIRASGAEVVGVDASPEMVRAAQGRGLDARVMDAEALAFEQEFDAVFSNAVLHWVRHPDAVLDGVRRALKAGGRFVAEFGGAGNVAEIVGALDRALARRGRDPASVNPWYFPTADEYRARLEANGFAVDRIELFPRPTPLPVELGDWLDTFAGAFLAAVPEDERTAAKDEVARELAPRLRDGHGRWTADYVRLRVVARLA